MTLDFAGFNKKESYLRKLISEIDNLEWNYFYKDREDMFITNLNNNKITFYINKQLVIFIELFHLNFSIKETNSEQISNLMYELKDLILYKYYINLEKNLHG